VGGQIGRERASTVPGANIPILGDVIKNRGERLGRERAGDLYNKTKSQVKSGDVSGLIRTASAVGRELTQSVDLFDIVKGHLMSEGYVDTEEAALAIMANMSEEWRQSILLELTPLGVKTAGVVDDQRRGSNMAQDMQSIQTTLKKLKPKGPVVTPGGLPGV